MIPSQQIPVVLAVIVLLLGSVGSPTAVSAQTGPWQQLVDPREAGWSQDRLEQAHQLAVELQSGAVFVAQGGHAVLAWGDVTRAFKMASVRKSLVSALFGIHVDAGTIDLQQTLAELGIDDHLGLTDDERQARVVDLLRARSGVYHPAAYEPASMKRRRPERGSTAPGDSWLYNNWDFNTLGTIFERTVGRDLFEEFETRIATPVGMQDYSRADTIAFLEPTTSRHPAHLFRLSARDLARVGQLYLRRGQVGRQQILSERWVSESTRIQSPLPEGNPYGAGGYGYLWWVYPAKPSPELAIERFDVIIARGNGGQVLAVVPEAELVLVHCGDWYHDRGVSFQQVGRLFSMILDARGEPLTEEPRLQPLAARPFDHSLPAPVRPATVDLPGDQLDAMAGLYRASPGLAFRVHVYEGRLFAKPEGAPLAELELFAIGPDRFYSPVFPLEVRASPAENGVIQQLDIQLGPETLVGRREPSYAR